MLPQLVLKKKNRILKNRVTCGILVVIGKGKDEKLVQELSKRMSNGGPDESD